MKTKQKIKLGCLSLIDFTGDNKEKRTKKTKRIRNHPQIFIFAMSPRYVCLYVCIGESCLFIQGRNNE